MHIIQKVEDLLVDLFPYAKGNNERLKEELIRYYTYGPYKPNVVIEDGLVIINIDTPFIFSQQKDYKEAIVLCESGKYSKAKKILAALIKKNPTVSDYYRVYGQVLSAEGNQDEAVNYFIDALKWDPKNTYALL